MQIIFIDESGYVPNWEKNIAAQPYFVLSAVSLPINTLPATYDDIRSRFSAINLTGFSAGTLGRGFEIKANNIANGTGYWGSHNPERNSVRDLILDAPKHYGGMAFTIIVDKAAHSSKYVDPADPYLMSVQFLFERIQSYLEDLDDFAVCIFDQNTVVQPELAANATDLMRDGSTVLYRSEFYQGVVMKKNTIDRIIELSFGQSENSIGIQIADFFATMTYHYVRHGKPAGCGWWNLLEQSLYRKNKVLIGWGYKEFP